MMEFTINQGLSDKLYEAGFFMGDLANEEGFASKAISEIGLSEQEMRTGEYQSRIHPLDKPMYDALWDRFARGLNDELYCEYRIRGSRGVWHWIQTSAVVVERQADGSIGKVLGHDRNISARKASEEFVRDEIRGLRQKYELSESLRQAGQVISLGLSVGDSMEMVVQQMRQIVPFDALELYSVEDGGVVAVYRTEGAQESDPESVHLLAGELDSSIYPLVHDQTSGDGGPGSLMAVPVRASEALIGVALLWKRSAGAYTGSDFYPVMGVAELLALTIRNREVLHRAISELDRDELTGYLTRRAFDRDAPVIWKRVCTGGREHAVVMFDMDLFKQVNDVHGHQAGDAVIRAVAARIKSLMRENDLLGRYGGDEFIALLPDTRADTAAEIMERIRQAVLETEIAAISGSVTLSIGVSAGGDPDDLSGAISRADDALYRAKHNGRDRVEATVIPNKSKKFI